ncbi:1,2-diacylglycerol 3-alpha-glucosyltransferase [Parabacteroides sp. PF5-6]|nr:1,2-diacylglycerol 3-alpha-glucosyltransferase [Parabacteroides sp. PF5-6]
MKILILNSILYTAEKNILPKVESIKDCMIYTFALGFKELGHEVTLVAAEEYKPTRSEVYDFEIVFLKSNLKSLFKVSYFPLHLSLFSFLRKRKNEYDLVISSEAFSTHSFMAALVVPSKLLVWQELFVHNRLFYRLPSLFWYNCVVRLLYRNIRIVPRSKKAYDFISQYAKRVSKTCVEHGMKLIDLPDTITKENQFVVVSQLIERKRVDLILRKFARFLSVYPQYSSYLLYILGRGEMEDQLKRLVEELGIGANVVFEGFVRHDKLFSIVSQSKALLVNTQKDLNVVSIPEAISAGTPVISNSQPGSAYYTQEENLGIIDDNWGEHDLRTIIEKNSYYTTNCLNYRGKLSNISVAETIIDIFYSKP